MNLTIHVIIEDIIKNNWMSLKAGRIEKQAMTFWTGSRDDRVFRKHGVFSIRTTRRTKLRVKNHRGT